MRGLARSCLAPWLVAAVLCLPASAGAADRVPRDFFGAQADGPLLDARFDAGAEYDLMARTGVRRIRIGVPWSAMQPYRSGGEVPPGRRAWFTEFPDGVPTDFAEVDRSVTEAARRGIDVLPTVTFAPDWAARHPGQRNSPPLGTAAYARFCAALARRYGPGGALWRRRPDLPERPIRRWQVWNEPNQATYNWSDQPFAADYVALLRAARRAIRREDPRARIVLAGLVGPGAPAALRDVYRAGGRGLFDEAAAHPYAREVSGTLRIVRELRAQMRRFGDADVPLLLTEVTWPAAEGQGPLTRRYGFETTEVGQAERLRAALRALLGHRTRLRIRALYWLTWISDAPRVRNDPFDFAGLRHLERDGAVRSRPALRVYRRFARGAAAG